MIISASRRTDIPAFYSDWLFNRIREGFCAVKNPFNPKQIFNVSLKPEDVTAIAFWTRNSGPMLNRLPILDGHGYKYYFMYTLNNYPVVYEPFNPGYAAALKNFMRLSEKIGAGRVVWRYDPIFITKELTFDFHLDNFNKIATDLYGSTNKVIISLISPYRKTLRRMEKAGAVLKPDIREHNELLPFLKELKKLSVKYNLDISVCSEEKDISGSGIYPARCIDDVLLKKEMRLKIEYKKDRSQRKFCNCMISKDIGANNTCVMGCRYCYATISRKSSLKNFRKHDPESPFLL